MYFTVCTLCNPFHGQETPWLECWSTFLIRICLSFGGPFLSHAIAFRHSCLSSFLFLLFFPWLCFKIVSYLGPSVMIFALQRFKPPRAEFSWQDLASYMVLMPSDSFVQQTAQVWKTALTPASYLQPSHLFSSCSFWDFSAFALPGLPLRPYTTVATLESNTCFSGIVLCEIFLVYLW